MQLPTQLASLPDIHNPHCCPNPHIFFWTSQSCSHLPDTPWSPGCSSHPSPRWHCKHSPTGEARSCQQGHYPRILLPTPGEVLGLSVILHSICMTAALQPAPFPASGRTLESKFSPKNGQAAFGELNLSRWNNILDQPSRPSLCFSPKKKK